MAVTPGPTPKTMADVHDLAALLAELDVTGEAAGEVTGTMAALLGDRQQVPEGAPPAALRHATKAGYRASDPSWGDLSELNRELEDLFGTTAPGPLGMSN